MSNSSAIVSKKWVKANSQHGFSLVELSIVLVILGLLVGGILGGQSLIKAAELRSVANEYNAHVTALNAFRIKYSAIPGDMNIATRFWGQSPHCPGSATQGATGTTCDGNGNGRIESTINPSGAGGINPNSNEWYRAWEHLANAGLVSGEFTGVRGPGYAQHAVVNWNVPGSKISGAGWTLNYVGNDTGNDGDEGWFALDYGHVLVFGGETTHSETMAAVLTPEEAWSIDSKLDDGMPGKGKVIAINIGQCTDTSSRTAANTAEYALATPTVACAFDFRHVFEK